MFLGAPGGSLRRYVSSATAEDLAHRVSDAAHTPRLPASDVFSTAFVTGMRDFGYRGGENLIVEWRYAAGDYKRLAGFAAELVVLNLQVIVTYGTAAAKSLKATTQTVRSSLRRRSTWSALASSTVWRGLAVT